MAHLVDCAAAGGGAVSEARWRSGAVQQRRRQQQRGSGGAQFGRRNFESAWRRGAIRGAARGGGGGAGALRPMIASLIVLKRDCICCSKFCTKIVRSSVDCMAAGSAAAASAPAPAASALLGSSACGGR